jgi:hypothetical protein
MVTNNLRVILAGLDAAGRRRMIVRGPPRMGPKLLVGGGPKRRALYTSTPNNLISLCCFFKCGMSVYLL